MQPFFAISWLITWFSHEIKDMGEVSRLFDALICSHPLYSLYICAAFVLHYKQEIMSTECDFATLHRFVTKSHGCIDRFYRSHRPTQLNSFIVQLPKNYGVPVENIIKIADTLMKRTPPEEIKGKLNPDLMNLIQHGKVNVKSTFIQSANYWWWAILN